MTTVEQQAGSAIRPFRVEFPEEALTDLRRRLAATRWPSRELVDDRSQGVQLAPLQALASYWANDYDLRRVETRLNALPHVINLDPALSSTVPPLNCVVLKALKNSSRN